MDKDFPSGSPMQRRIPNGCTLNTCQSMFALSVFVSAHSSHGAPADTGLWQWTQMTDTKDGGKCQPLIIPYCKTFIPFPIDSGLKWPMPKMVEGISLLLFSTVKFHTFPLWILTGSITQHWLLNSFSPSFFLFLPSSTTAQLTPTSQPTLL